MNKDRIQIDGVWYVREKEMPETKMEILKSKSIATENKKYYFEATMGEREDGTFYTDFDIEFTDKRGGSRADGNWKTEFWDNMNFFRGCLRRDAESLEELRKSVCEEGVEEFIAFLKILEKEGWLY